MMQFIPGLDQIWVSRLNESDVELVYETEQEALDKINELQNLDTLGRKYKVEQI